MLVIFMLAVKHFMFFLDISIRFAPRTVVFKNTGLSFVVMLPITTLGRPVGVEGSTWLTLPIFITTGVLRIFILKIFGRFLSLVLKINYLVCTVNCVSLQTFR